MAPQLNRAKWWESLRGLGSERLQAAMSCIAYFETGGLEVDLKELGQHVFALRHATSIFVASRLLGDPADDVIEHGIESQRQRRQTGAFHF
jgi:hypothetical protein